jgi:hypothetical protein
MSTRTPYLQSNKRSYIDHLLGLQGWGLILYGVLPASFFALGVLKLTTIDLHRSEIRLPLLLISAAPVGVLFLLVRQRLSAWYLFMDGLWVRSCIVTLLILLLSTMISITAGLVSGSYISISWKEWNSLTSPNRWLPYLESYLVAIMSLVGSSTLFLTAVKESGGLPGLPLTDLIQDIKVSSDSLAQIQTNIIWNSYPGAIPDSLQESIKKTHKALERLKRRSPRLLAQRELYEGLDNDLSQLQNALVAVAGVPANWGAYFDRNQEPEGLSSHQMAIRESVLHLPKVRING